MSEKELPEVPELVVQMPEPEPQHPYDIAMLIDNTVYQCYNCDGQQAAAFLSQPKFVQYINGEAKIGYKYDPETESFRRPIYDAETDTYH